MSLVRSPRSHGAAAARDPATSGLSPTSRSADLHKALRQAEFERDLFQTRLKEAQAATAAAVSDAVTSAIRDLQAQLTAQVELTAVSESAGRAAREQVGKLQAVIQELRQQLAQVRQPPTSAAGRTPRQDKDRLIADLESKCAAQREALVANTAELETLRHRVTEAEAAHARLSDQAHRAARDLESKAAEWHRTSGVQAHALQAAQARVQDLEHTVAASEARNSEAAIRIRNLENKLEAYTSHALEREKSDTASHRAASAAVLSQQRAHAEELAAWNSQRQTLQDQIKSLQQELRTAQTALQQAKVTHQQSEAAWTSRLQQLDAAHVAVESSCAAATASARDSQQALVSAKAAWEVERTSLRQQLQASGKEVGSLRTMNSELQEHIERLERGNTRLALESDNANLKALSQQLKSTRAHFAVKEKDLLSARTEERMLRMEAESELTRLRAQLDASTAELADKSRQLEAVSARLRSLIETGEEFMTEQQRNLRGELKSLQSKAEAVRAKYSNAARDGLPAKQRSISLPQTSENLPSRRSDAGTTAFPAIGAEDFAERLQRRARMEV